MPNEGRDDSTAGHCGQNTSCDMSISISSEPSANASYLSLLKSSPLETTGKLNSLFNQSFSSISSGELEFDNSLEQSCGTSVKCGHESRDADTSGTGSDKENKCPAFLAPIKKQSGNDNTGKISFSSSNDTSASSGIIVDMSDSSSSTEAKDIPKSNITLKEATRKEFVKVMKNCYAPDLILEETDNEKYEGERKTENEDAEGAGGRGPSQSRDRNSGYLQAGRARNSNSNDRFKFGTDTRFNGIYSSTPIRTRSQHDFGRLSIHRCPEDKSFGAFITSDGIISIQLIGGTRVDLTVNKGIRIVNEQAKTLIALSPTGKEAAMIHPSGKVYQYGSRVEISTHESGNNRIAKMWFKGISFSTELGALVYLLDSGGARTIHDVFSDMTGDFTIPVFKLNADMGSHCVAEASRQLQESQYRTDELGLTENWLINGIKVTRTPDDVVRVIRGANKYEMRVCGSGLASMSSPFIYSTASYRKSRGPEASHLFVRRGERRLHYDGVNFILRDGGHSVGFDIRGEFKVF